MIVSCGEALVDLIPDAVPGGGPMNVAIAAARLGAPAAFVGRVSTDRHGDLIWQHLERNGVELAAAQRGSEPTARAIVDHVPQLVFRFEGEGTADTALSRVDLDQLGPGPHIVHGGALGLFRGKTAETLAQLAERHGGIASLDPNVRPDMIDDRRRWDHFYDRWMANTHVYRASDEDLTWIHGNRALESIAEELLDGAVRVVIVTRGPNGATVYAAAGEVSVPGRSVDVVDTVGAGDTFVASILVSLWQRAVTSPEQLGRLDLSTWEAVAQRAVTAAAITCSRRGADPPYADEIESSA